MINKINISHIILLFVYFIPVKAWAQNCTTSYQIETFGSTTAGKYTPFWIVSNKYGSIPLQTGNGYLRVGTFHNQSFQKGFHLSVGADLLAVTSRFRNVYIQQLFATMQYKNLNLTVGSKENYSSLWDKELSSGDMVHSINARPIPEINLSVPRFTAVPFSKGRLQFMGNLAHGRSFDSQYLKSFTNENAVYTKNTLWHRKSLYIAILDPNGKFPLKVVAGIQHHAQWGGTSTNEAIGKQPQSFKDWIRVFLGRSGGEDATISDQINVLGNHYGSYDIQFGYLNPIFDLHIYRQHFFDDNSGMELRNLPDGLYGFQVDFQNFSLINKIVAEFLTTRHQSGPVNYINFDHSKYPGYGGGVDNYYNNGGYPTGISYFNRGIGSPLLTSPEYNKDNVLGFLNNRVRSFHVGFQGNLSKQVLYRILATSSENWGVMRAPLLKKESNFLGGAKISWRYPQLEGWLFSGEIAADFGATYGNNIGFSFSIKKSGFFYGENKTK